MAENDNTKRLITDGQHRKSKQSLSKLIQEKKKQKTSNRKFRGVIRCGGLISTNNKSNRSN